MIKRLGIQRFKSIKGQSLDCRRVNVFIGAPDTGKTNILEALHLLSRLGWGLPLDGSLRLNQQLGFDTLFYQQFFDEPITIELDNKKITLSISGSDRRLLVSSPELGDRTVSFGQQAPFSRLSWLRFYSYLSSEHWSYQTIPMDEGKIVMPTYGGNLTYITRHNAKVYEFLKEIVAGLEWKLRFDQTQKRFVLSEVRKDEIIDYNLDVLSDSLKRLFFYGAILLSSEKATLILDEPDVAAFPPYPKTLGEMIAANSSNQFFLTTHNPYFLTGLVQKTPIEDLALFVCTRDPQEGTIATLVAPDHVSQVIEQGASIFFNLDDLVKR